MCQVSDSGKSFTRNALCLQFTVGRSVFWATVWDSPTPTAPQGKLPLGPLLSPSPYANRLRTL